MSNSFKERFVRMLHPYVMVLRHGCHRSDDLFDFSLALLYRDSGETLPSPKIPASILRELSELARLAEKFPLELLEPTQTSQTPIKASKKTATKTSMKTATKTTTKRSKAPFASRKKKETQKSG